MQWAGHVLADGGQQRRLCLRLRCRILWGVLWAASGLLWPRGDLFERRRMWEKKWRRRNRVSVQLLNSRYNNFLIFYLTSNSFFGFTGQNCETELITAYDPCQPNPCQHDGQCVANLENNTYICRCIDDYKPSDDCATKLVTKLFLFIL